MFLNVQLSWLVNQKQKNLTDKNYIQWIKNQQHDQCSPIPEQMNT